MGLHDLEIKKEYRTLRDNLVQGFYIPLLSNASYYKRAVGFFSSSSLVELSKGIGVLAKNGGKIQIIASPYLSEQDINDIRAGYEAREILSRAAIRQLSDDFPEYETKERLNLVGNLIASGIMDIRLAFTKDNHGIGMYHEKMGLIGDCDGYVVAFSGSMNESITAISINYEAIDVFCSWKSEEDSARVRLKEKAFAELWDNNDPAVTVLEVPKVSDEIIKRYKRNPPDFEIDNNQFGDVIVQDSGLYHGGYGKSGPILPSEDFLYDYQNDAIKAWAGEKYRGIFDMATGSGKTYTGLGAITVLANRLDNHLAVIIVCPYQHLVTQWVEDIVKFNIHPIIGFSSSPQTDWKKRLKRKVADQRITKGFFCFICTNATFKSSFVQQMINGISGPTLLVVDEAHNFGSPQLLKLLDDRFDYRLALSATLERHGDEEGTDGLLSFFGKKCIEYDLERAIKDKRLTKYDYHPIVVTLSPNELGYYYDLSFEISRHWKIDKKGKRKLDSYGEILAIKRSRIVAGAEQKIGKLKEAIRPYSDKYNILVYCGATNILQDSADESDTDEGDIRQIDAITKMLGKELGMTVSRFTASETVEERNFIKKEFQSGNNIQAIVAIKCLDEGVNIPGITTAFILASTTNPKEYIQRRGRVLRKAVGKDHSEIYDFITLPRPLDSVSALTKEQADYDVSLVRNEVSRIEEFARLARNKMEAYDLIWKIKEVYDIEGEQR